VVRAGDTLSKIAKEMLGDSGAFMDIFNANRDQLSDPNVIRPGQVLKIPVPVRR
jgi:nucleoid-associated protein YgaU